MIWDVVILFASGVSALLIWIISRVTLAMPEQFQTWLSYAFGYANVFKGIVAVSDLMSAVIVILSAYALKFGIVLFFRFVWPLIPYFGNKQIEPFATTSKTLDLRKTGNAVNLSYGNRPKGRIDKRMRF